MAIGWLLLLQSVPWTEVVKNAPRVADGAKKLWSAIASKKPPSPAAIAATAKPDLSPEARTIATLQRQVAELAAAVADQHNQLLASSELIKELAEQNTQLIRRIEANRVRTLWLTGATAIFGLLAISILVWLLVH